MNTLPELSFPFTLKSFIRFLAFFFLSIILLISTTFIPNTAQAAISFVGLSLRSYDQQPNGSPTSYIVLTYKGANGNERNHVYCQPIAFQSWYDIPVPDFIKAGQTIWIRYYSSPKCNPSSLLLQASPEVPQNPSFDHCWFNPNPTVNDLNWSGCVNPSEHVDLTFTSQTTNANQGGTVHVYLNRPTNSVFGSAYLMINGMVNSKCITVSKQNVDTFVGDFPAPLKNVSLAMFTDASCRSVANYNGPKADLNDPGYAVLTLQQYCNAGGDTSRLNGETPPISQVSVV